MNEVPILQSTIEQQGEIAKEVAQAVVVIQLLILSVVYVS